MNPKEILASIRKRSEYTSGFVSAVNWLKSSGTLAVIRSLGKGIPINTESNNYSEANIAAYNYMLGYQNALDILEEFLDVVVYPKNAPNVDDSTNIPNYGARDALIKEGLYTAEEIEKLSK